MTYEILGHIPQRDVCVEVEADNIDDALERFDRLEPDARPDSVCVLTSTHPPEVEIVGFDDGTGDAIFEGDTYNDDGGGCLTLITPRRNRVTLEREPGLRAAAQSPQGDTSPSHGCQDRSVDSAPRREIGETPC